jgi:sterol desaturase/sphingolipid hydroxylase (fatty acid hydroxylase superfamily)
MGLLLALAPFKTIVLAAAVFIPFERLVAERDQPILRRAWAWDVGNGFFNGIIDIVLLSAVAVTVLGGIDATANALLPNARVWVQSTPLWTQVIIAVVVGDLGTYVMHRLMHSLPWLWRFHVVHHSAEELDWLIAFRFHPVDAFLTRIGSLAALAALNVSPAAIASVVAVSSWQAWLIHANVRMSYGPLRWVFVSPEFHHWHHSAEPDVFNRNYGGMLAVWDLMFGTVHLPRTGPTLRYGGTEPVPARYVERFCHPFRRRSSADPVLDGTNRDRGRLTQGCAHDADAREVAARTS